MMRVTQDSSFDDVEELRRRFEEFRSQHQRRTRLPEELWRAAARNWHPTRPHGCPGITLRRWREWKYDESCLAGKDRLRPWLGDIMKCP